MSKLASLPLRLARLLTFFLFYSKEVILSNLRVAYDVLTPRLHLTPKVVAMPLSVHLSEHQLLALANLITMTPGTLSLDISEDRRTLLIHTLYTGENEEAFITDLKENYERRVCALF